MLQDSVENIKICETESRFNSTVVKLSNKFIIKK